MSSSLPVPRTVEEITPSWLTNMFRAGGELGEGQVVAIDARPIGQEAGFLDGLARLNLTYDLAEVTSPSSVVVKLPSSEAIYRQIGNRYNAYERECRFYAEVAPSSTARLPRCYYQEMDRATGACLLVLEDLGDLDPGDQVRGLTQAQAMAAIQTIGRFQAHWWESPALAGLGWMPSRNLQPARYHDFWPRFQRTIGPQLPEAARTLGEKVGKNIEWLLQSMETQPHTIVHSDFRADNLLFDSRSHSEPVVIVDWQLAIRSRGIMDVARMLCGSLSPQDRSACEMAVLEQWRQTLEHGGVIDYSLEQVVRDYKLAALLCLYYPVTIHEAEEAAGARGAALASSQIERFFAAALHLDGESLLPE